MMERVGPVQKRFQGDRSASGNKAGHKLHDVERLAAAQGSASKMRSSPASGFFETRRLPVKLRQSQQQIRQ